MLTLAHNIILPNRPDPANVMRLDMSCLPMLSSMERNGMGIDKEFMVQLHSRITGEMEELSAEVEKLTGYSINLGSGDQLADMLFGKMGLKQQGKEKKTSKKTRLALDSNVLKAMISQHACIKPILDWKEREKLRSTYTYNLIKQADEYGRIHPSIIHTGPETGRLACKDPNLQNIPTRSKLGMEIRNAFVPGKGTWIGTVDVGQIEMRAQAIMSLCRNMLEGVFWVGEDLYWKTAEMMYERVFTPYQREHEIEPLTGLPVEKYFRFNAKTTTLGVSYDIGPDGLVDQFLKSGALGFLTEGDYVYDAKGKLVWDFDRHYKRALTKCTKAIQDFFKGYPELLEMRAKYHRIARMYGYVFDIFGRIRWIPQVRSCHKWIVGEGLRAAGNMPVQGCLSGNMKVMDSVLGMRTMKELSGRVSTLWDGKQWSTGKVVFSGHKRLCRLKLHDGLSFECSPDHEILIRTPKCERWMTVSELFDKQKSISKAGWNNYRVALSGEVDKWKSSSRLPNSWNPTWIGRIASDGGVANRSDGGSGFTLLVAEHEKEILPDIEKWTSRVNGYTLQEYRRKNRNQKMYKISSYSSRIARKMRRMGVKVHIPDEVFSDKSTLRKYLRGLFDGDGGISGKDNIKLTFGGGSDGSKHLSWALDVRHALILLGIPARVHPNKKCHRVDVLIMKSDVRKFCNDIGFINSKKQKLGMSLGDSANGNAAYGRAVGIDSIEITDLYVPMYDFMDSTTGQFSSEGIIVHNSAAGIVKLWMAVIWDRYVEYWSKHGIKLLMQIHDEILAEGPKQVLIDFLEECGLILNNLIPYDYFNVPLESKYGIGERWGLIPK